MLTRTRAFEYGFAVVTFAAVLAISLATQEPMTANAGRGFDGATYYAAAEQLAAGGAPAGEARFASRLGTPLLAALVSPDDLIDGFRIVNLSAALVSTLLFLAWLRRYLDTPWLRLVLVAVYASHWLQLIRFTVFYPVLADACAQAFCFAGLLAIGAYQKTPSAGTLAIVAAISAVGVVFREIVLLVPLAFLFSRNPRATWLPRWPFVRVAPAPIREWIPLALAAAALLLVGTSVEATDSGFSASTHLLQRAMARTTLSYLLGWLVAFGPVIAVVLFEWRTAASFFARHRWAAAYMAGVATAGWAASLESGRHALNWGAPVAYLLIGLAIQQNPRWYRGALLAVLLGTQAVVNRLFWNIPQPVDDYLRHMPTMALTPLGDVTYLHLFPDQLPRPMAWLQAAQHAVVAAAVVVFLWWRMFDRGPSLSPAPRVAAALTAARERVAATLRTGRGTLGLIGLRNAMWLGVLFVAVAAASAALLVRTFETLPVRLNVRWTAEGVTHRERLEGELKLEQGSKQEGTTWTYSLSDGSTENIRAVVQHPAVDDTAHVDRTRFQPEGVDLIERKARRFGILMGFVAVIAAGRRQLRRARGHPVHWEDHASEDRPARGSWL